MEDMILSLIKEGIKHKDISRQLDTSISLSEISKIRKNAGLGTGRYFTLEAEEEVCSLYIDELLPLSVIANKYGSSSKKVREILVSHGFNIRKPGDTLRIVKDNPFKDYLTNPDSQYWIWFMIGDATIHSRNKKNKGYRVSLSLKRGDEDHVGRYCNHVGYGLKYHNYDFLQKGVLRKKTTASFSHPETYQFLLDLGVIPNKSLVIEPTLDLTIAGLRGLFDADGCIDIFFDKSGTECARVRYRSHSAPLFLIIKSAMLEHGWGKLKTNNNVASGELSYAALGQVCNIYEAFYGDPCAVYLPRKKMKFWESEKFRNEMSRRYGTSDRNEIDRLINENYKNSGNKLH